MKDGRGSPLDIDEYIAGFPIEIREILRKLRKSIQALAPEAEEKASYQIPTFSLHGRNLIHPRHRRGTSASTLCQGEARHSTGGWPHLGLAREGCNSPWPRQCPMG